MNQRICPCCNQIVVESAKDASDKHLKAVMKIHKMNLNDLKIKTKKSNYVAARHYFWFLLCVESGWSLPRAARKTGHSDHTTVLHAVRKISAELYDTSPNAGIHLIRQIYAEATKGMKYVPS